MIGGTSDDDIEPSPIIVLLTHADMAPMDLVVGKIRVFSCLSFTPLILVRVSRSYI